MPHLGRHCVHGARKRSRRSIIAVLGACIELVKPFYRGALLRKIQLGLLSKKNAGGNSDAFGKVSNVGIGRRRHRRRHMLNDFVVKNAFDIANRDQ